jgi:hypothetical protein
MNGIRTRTRIWNNIIVQKQFPGASRTTRGPPSAAARFAVEDPADQRFPLSQSTIRSCASWIQQPQLPVTQ